VIYKNLTDRTIVIATGEDEGFKLTSIPPEPRSATADIIEHVLEVFGDIPVVNYIYRSPAHIPPPKDGVVYIVKYAVLKALSGCRPDIVAPDTSPSGVVRDKMSGKVLAVRKFQKL
jgi:hypothetical protein